MSMLSENRCRYFRGSKLLINHEVSKSTKQKPILKGLRVLGALRGYFLESLRAFFECSGFAAQIRERFAGEME